MHKGLASVIVPVYNGSRYLAKTLESVLAQEYPDVEVIAVDDGSTDGSAEIIRRFPAVRYFYQENQGVTVARNNGISRATGEYIAFIDQDDIWTPDKLAVQIDYLEKNPGTGFVLSKSRMFLESGADLPPWLKPSYLEEEHVGFIPGTFLVRRNVLDMVGHYDARYAIASDTDWFSRAMDAGISMHTLPAVLLYKRVHTDNLSNEDDTIREELLKVFRDSIVRKRKRAAAKAGKEKAS